MTKRFTDFIQKTLLSDQEMATIERDLRFRPADPNTAQTLTAEQVTRFNRDGYVLPLPFFSAEEIEDFRTYFCLLYTSPSPRDGLLSRMPSSA